MSLPDRKLKQTTRPSKIYKVDSIYFETNATHFSLSSRIPVLVLVLLERFPFVTNSSIRRLTASILKEMNSVMYSTGKGNSYVT